MNNKTGVLLINLGTPDQCKPKAVYQYLSEFLNDPRVIDLPTVIRWILVNVFIIPFRYKKTTEAYQKIWTKEGSPLLVHIQQLQSAVAMALGSHYQVEIGMRYGSPNIGVALEKLKDCAEIKVIPLFPQYSSAATGSAVESIRKKIKNDQNENKIHIIKDFYNYSGFINAICEKMRNTLHLENIDKLVMSYHGLPEHHLDKAHCAASCDRVHACPSLNTSNSSCYRAQCYETSRLIAEQLQISKEKYIVTFQSRLGRTSWIKPYTDFVLQELYEKGVRRIAIVSPSFVTDCLETLEEINIRMREQWTALGGTEFHFVPCINASASWVEGLVRLIQKSN